jgi:TetR/AcrR family transcriptional regulator, mexCD-oprJ operon repressor
LRRVVATTWEKLGRYHPLVAINTQLPPAELRRRHASVLGALEPLIQRGQKDGAFRSDVPAAWHLSMLLALMHAASGEVQAGRLPGADAEAAVAATVLGALATNR